MPHDAECASALRYGGWRSRAWAGWESGPDIHQWRRCV